MLTSTWKSVCEIAVECLGVGYVIRKCQTAFWVILNFHWNMVKIVRMVFYDLCISLSCLYSWSHVLGSYAVEKRDVTGKAGIFQRGALILCWDHARTSLNTWKMVEYFYGYLIFISKVWTQDFLPLLQFTPRSTVISFKLTYAVFAYSLVEH